MRHDFVFLPILVFQTSGDSSEKHALIDVSKIKSEPA